MLILTFTDATTGATVEHWQRETPLAFAPDTFWIAYFDHPIRDGVTGDTAEEALARLPARRMAA
jgi:hypothetical protein